MEFTVSLQRVSVLERILAWFEENRRDLPWRRTRDPYAIMVSEIMLQQTQVDRVIPYFHAWLERFPTVHELADAPTADVIRMWKGLGYNRRAVNMQRAAQAVVERGGSFPESYDELLKLPGIGPYTAGAIACFAFEHDVAFIDTNMRRVLHRIFIGVDVPKPAVSDKAVLEIGWDMLPMGDAWRWNQALMEFGAVHCTARKPLCLVCPVQHACAAFPDIQAALATAGKRTAATAAVPFEQTTRYFRGRIVDALREHEGEGVPLAAIGPQIKADYAEDRDGAWLIELVHGLERDGLAKIAEAETEYDAGVRVRLP